MMLVGGDEPVFTAPVARFYDELARMEKRLKIPRPPFPVVESTNGWREATRDGDIAELRAALSRSGVKREQFEAMVTAYSAAREALREYAVERESWSDAEESRKSRPSWLKQEASEPAAPPKFPQLSPPVGLPEEFADYFRGAVAWHRGDKNGAREAWQALLERPSGKRHYKSTWAAFMLAKSWESENKTKAVSYYALVRALAKEGFADSLGLAASSIGWQARVHLANNEFEPAMERYLEQLAGEDGTAYQSLRIVARKALAAKPAVLLALAKNPRTRAVITAYLIASGRGYSGDEEGARVTNPSEAWLQAVERAGVTDLDSAEQLALANYQLGNFEVAQRWVKRATNSPVSQWLQAKLLLRDGKVDKAASLLVKLTRVFPLIEPTNAANIALFENLYVPGGETSEMSIGRQALGELGVLRLHRREYGQALDALLRAGFWIDAAYVAERVLTVDELKHYVDSNWPEVLKDEDEDQHLPKGMKLSTQSKDIRYLLARRLTRLGHSIAAREYVPEEWLAKFDELMLHLAIAQDESRPKEERATNYWRAAWIVKTNGMELIGTEVQPDFTVWSGGFEDGPSMEERSTNAPLTITGASADELKRGAEHNVDPDYRFHYRWHAAALALEGAKLLPNNDDLMARILYDGGSFLKGRDPDTADIFYKMLVRRCRKTELGEAADRQRWFPALDADGKPIVTRGPKSETKWPGPLETIPAESADVLPPPIGDPPTGKE
jgi:hypothetical protein